MSDRPTRFCLLVLLGAVTAAMVCSNGPGSEVARAEQTKRKVAVTVDDLPGAIPATPTANGERRELERYNEAIPAILKAHHAPAIGFVNEKKLNVAGERDARAALLQRWIDAGFELGNHTYSHANFNKVSLQEMEDETIRGEVITRSLLMHAGKAERYFRYPYLFTGPTAELKEAFEGFLKSRGYKNAPVTVDNADYMFNDILCDAMARKDSKLAEKAKREYLQFAQTEFEYFEEASRKLFGREIPQVFLMHDNEINTETLDELLGLLEKRGYQFVTLDEALSDPAYATPDRFAGTAGISWIDRWRVSFGQKADYEHDPDPPEWVMKRFAEIRKAAANQ
ncbi:MAG TPA: polysaccharide deacetylase family protein [Candidatus Acidoferrum sp.]|nr:polysaccharide deacetylase family protein [Candidatus Acidoferrum sp.]